MRRVSIKRVPKPRASAEYDLQCRVVALLRASGAKGWHHPANGEHRDIRTAVRLKKMGVNPGVPDLVFTLPSGASAYMEIKGPKGTLSPAQKNFRDWCLDGEIPYALVFDFDTAREILRFWGVIRSTAGAK